MPLEIKLQPMKKLFLSVFLLILFAGKAQTTNKIPIKIENNIKSAPVTLGIPFPQGELHSVDNLRLLTSDGREIPCQTTKVANWRPIDTSIKWVWVFFFSNQDSNYILEYGQSIVPIRSKKRIVSTNNMRPGGGIQVNTGPLSFSLNKMGDGFLDEVYIDSNENGNFEKNELICSSPEKKGRGTFLDLLDDQGIDASTATINEVFRERGSGPMHTIFRIEGTYTYNRADNNLSPFTMRIHAYAGKSYIKVLHTLTYTGVPDKHKIQDGEHYKIATQNENILSEDKSDDPGWTQPNDQIAACGIQLKYHLEKDVDVSMPLIEKIEQDDVAEVFSHKIHPNDKESIKLLQKGPDRIEKNGDEREKEEDQEVSSSGKFEATVTKGDTNMTKAGKAKGYATISNGTRGVSIGIKNCLKEYPKGIDINPICETLTGNIWPLENGPMSFERRNAELENGMLANMAQGLTKTTEFIYYFHDNPDNEQIDKKMDYIVNSPVAHTTAEWYTSSKVYGNMAPASSKHPELENALQYRYEWWGFNQKNEPWYGMFDYGDGKTYFVNNKWIQWNNNEPTVDFMLWTNFMRTGDAKYFKMAQAMSRHTMDVDNIHWPKKRTYIGTSNDAIDFWNYEDEPESTPYLGIGRRHGSEHWYAALSAHVWIQGWLASYYLSADHRALKVAKMTGDTYLKRIWGEHGLRGRRLYLSVLNLVELYDATKLERFKKELDQRVSLMLKFQKRQGGNLLLDRFGYSQTYVAQGLYKYQQIIDDDKIRDKVRRALIEHARWVRDVPPLNHEMESYLATIYPLLIGYEFSGDKVFFEEAKSRAELLKVGELEKSSEEYTNTIRYSEDLLDISNLPESKRSFTNWQTNQGLRVFGWTHAYNIPYLLYWMNTEEKK